MRLTIATSWGRRAYSACYHYRQFTPLAALKNLNLADIILFDRMPISPAEVSGADFHLVYFRADRSLLKHIYDLNRQRVLPHNKEHCSLFVYDADDDTEYISPFNPTFCHFGTRIGETIIPPGEELFVDTDQGRVVLYRDKAIDPLSDFDVLKNRGLMRLVAMTARACQGVTCSTEELAKVYRHRYGCKNVIVFPNSLLREDYPPIRVEKPKQLTILWAGGSAHYEDWMSVKDAIQEVCAARPHVKFLTWGQAFATVQRYIPPGMHEHLAWCPYEKFTLRLATIGHSITIAPLADTQFNRCKSGIRWLESSAIHRPAAVLAANLPPYVAIKHGETGMLYNTQEEFHDMLIAMIDDQGECRRMARRAHEQVWDEFDAHKTVLPLHTFYQKIKYENT